MDLERILEQALQPTLAHIEEMERRVPRSVRSMLVDIRLHIVEPGYRVTVLQRNLGAVGNNWILGEFKAAVGLPVWRFIQEGRLETAARMLGNTKVTVGDVVTLVGYVDSSSFTRLFRGWCGMTPGRFRSRARVARRRAGSIPDEIFNWFFLRRCVRFDLAPPQRKDLLAYLEKVLGPLPRPPQRPPGFSPPENFFPTDSHDDFGP